jgi:hypothetical protein
MQYRINAYRGLWRKFGRSPFVIPRLVRGTILIYIILLMGTFPSPYTGSGMASIELQR